MIFKDQLKSFILSKSLPNWLSFLRLLVIPFFVFLMHEPTNLSVNFAALVFAFAVLTDCVDGWIARRFGSESDFGKLLDPLADKILTMAALVMLASLRSDIYGEPWVPGWIVVLVLAREIWVTGLRGMAAAQGIVLPASSAGKVKTAFQNIAVFFLLLHDAPVPLLSFKMTFQVLGLNLLIISLGFSYLGAIEYTFAAFKAKSQPVS